MDIFALAFWGFLKVFFKRSYHLVVFKLLKFSPKSFFKLLWLQAVDHYYKALYSRCLRDSQTPFCSLQLTLRKRFRQKIWGFLVVIITTIIRILCDYLLGVTSKSMKFWGIRLSCKYLEIGIVSCQLVLTSANNLETFINLWEWNKIIQ